MARQYFKFRRTGQVRASLLESRMVAIDQVGFIRAIDGYPVPGFTELLISRCPNEGVNRTRWFPGGVQEALSQWEKQLKVEAPQVDTVIEPDDPQELNPQVFENRGEMAPSRFPSAGDTPGALVARANHLHMQLRADKTWGDLVAPGDIEACARAAKWSHEMTKSAVDYLVGNECLRPTDNGNYVLHSA